MDGRDYWESKFAQQFEKIENKQKPGAMLSLIPSRDDWLEFIEFVREQWRFEEGYHAVRRERPHCFVVLFGGVAFYEYDEHRYWPQFAKAVGSKTIPANLQHEISEDFNAAAKKLGLQIIRREDSADYVGSAVYQIGIPLSLWTHFLKVCKWAFHNDDWESLSDSSWKELVSKRFPNIPRLGNFFIQNREAATLFIREMLKARQFLNGDLNLTVSDLKQKSILRPEYFDEVPETAEFLRPSNPDSLFQDRAKLVWDEQRSHLSLYLPAVANDKLPATWKIGRLEQLAASTPDSLQLDALAFSERLLLQLDSSECIETQRLRGLAPFGLWDCEREKFVPLDREALPVGDYHLISREKIDFAQRGFDEFDADNSPFNELFELSNGASCYLTRLLPNDKSAELSFSDGRKIKFRSGLKIEAHIFAGQGSFSTNFTCYPKWSNPEWIKIERLPLLCLAVPFGIFEDPEKALQQKFKVIAGGETTEGIWEKQHEDDVQEFYVWHWETEPQLKKKVTIAILAKELGIRFEYQIEMLQTKLPENCWKNLPGKFLPLVLLAQPVIQMKDGMKWQNLLTAREAIAPDGPQIWRNYLKEYVNRGFLEFQGHRWRIIESRCKLESTDEGDCLMSYCGNPAILWGMFRRIHELHPQSSLPEVEVVKGELPYLEVLWNARQTEVVKKYLGNHKEVRIVSDLWRP